MEANEFRNAVLNEVLKIINDKAIQVDGQRLEIKTYLSVGYEPSKLPWITHDPLEPAAGDGDPAASFDTVSPDGEQFPTAYRWRLELIAS
jgi:hypothetical protein